MDYSTARSGRLFVLQEKGLRKRGLPGSTALGEEALLSGGSHCDALEMDCGVGGEDEKRMDRFIYLRGSGSRSSERAEATEPPITTSYTVYRLRVNHG